MQTISKLKKLSRKSLDFINRMRTVRINWREIMLDLFLLLIIIVLSQNIFTAYRQGVKNLEIVAGEQAEVEELTAERERLLELKEYYSSSEYRQAYARESLNLTQPGEELFVVNRDEAVLGEKTAEDYYQIDFSDSISWWKRLLLH